MSDLFSLLDEAGLALAGAIHPELLGAELQRAARTAPSARDAWHLFIQAQNLLAGPSAEANAEARRLFEAAIAIGQGAARSNAGLALTHV